MKTGIQTKAELPVISADNNYGIIGGMQASKAYIGSSFEQNYMLNHNQVFISHPLLDSNECYEQDENPYSVDETFHDVRAVFALRYTRALRTQSK